MGNSRATEKNALLQWFARKPREGNVDWIVRAATDSDIARAAADTSLVVLVGGTDPMAFRFRLAQAHLRADLSPSAWSHACFLRALDPLRPGQSETFGISAAPRDWYPPHGYAPVTNAIQRGRLAAFDSARVHPNIALLSIPRRSDDVYAAIRRLAHERGTIDFSVLLLRWLQFAWGAGMPANPLGEGLGMPSTAMLSAAYASLGFDLTPGLESRASCPEAIWQAARWWHEYYRTHEQDEGRILGAYCDGNALVPEAFFDDPWASKPTA